MRNDFPLRYTITWVLCRFIYCCFGHIFRLSDVLTVYEFSPRLECAEELVVPEVHVHGVWSQVVEDVVEAGGAAVDDQPHATRGGNLPAENKRLRIARECKWIIKEVQKKSSSAYPATTVAAAKAEAETTITTTAATATTLTVTTKTTAIVNKKFLLE